MVHETKTKATSMGSRSLIKSEPRTQTESFGFFTYERRQLSPLESVVTGSGEGIPTTAGSIGCVDRTAPPPYADVQNPMDLFEEIVRMRKAGLRGALATI